MVSSAYHEIPYFNRLVIGYMNLQARIFLGTPLHRVIAIA
jgi:hypothetical protein